MNSENQTAFSERVLLMTVCNASRTGSSNPAADTTAGSHSIEGLNLDLQDSPRSGDNDSAYHTIHKYSDDLAIVQVVDKETGECLERFSITKGKDGNWYEGTKKNLKTPLYCEDRLAEAPGDYKQVIVQDEACADMINTLAGDDFRYVAVTAALDGDGDLEADWAAIRTDLPLLIWPAAGMVGQRFLLRTAEKLISMSKWESNTWVMSSVGLQSPVQIAQGASDPSHQAKLIDDRIDCRANRIALETMAARIIGGNAEAEVTQENTEFLLMTPDGTGLFPLNALSAVAGDGGTGKSIFLKRLAVAVINGESSLSHMRIHPAMRGAMVAYFSKDEGGEIPKAHILSLGGCNLNRVLTSGIRDIENTHDIKKLVSEFKDLCKKKPLAMVVVDTGDDFLGGRADGNSDAQVKAALNVLRELAESTGAAVVFTKHFNKTRGRLKERINGSTAWTNKPRQMLALVRDPAGDKDVTILTCVKSNCGKFDISLTGMMINRKDAGEIPSVSIFETNVDFADLEQRIINQSNLYKVVNRSEFDDSQIEGWILSTIEESGNGITATELDAKSRSRQLPVNKFRSARARLNEQNKIAASNSRHGPVTWTIAKAEVEVKTAAENVPAETVV